MFWVLILGCATPPSPDHVDRSATGPDSASTPSTDPLGSTPPAGTTPTTGSTPTVSTPTGGTDTSSTDPGPAGIAVCVNELMARNQVSTASGEDWVELFAPGDAVSLDGWWISDDPDRPLAVPLAGLEVPAGGALVLEAERELSFGLSGDGDAVVLTDPWGHTDTVRFGETGSDQAWTRTADCCAGADCWSPVHGGTPGRSNVVVTEDVTLVAPGSIWKVYTDEPAREWLNPGWLDGGVGAHQRAPVGWGHPDVESVPSVGPPTLWVRHTFDHTGEADGLMLDLRANDGAVVWLNGGELVRVRLPEGPLDGDTPAEAEAPDGWETWELPAALLRPGANVVAIELHSALRSPDLVADLELRAAASGR